MTDLQKNRLRQEYQARINRVIDYIEGHIDHPLTLQEVARVANFSQYHFHRIFGAIMGETLHQFIQRLRLEKAAEHLASRPHMAITDVALDLGFSGSAVFSRAFREAFEMSPTAWRNGGYRERKNRQTMSNYDQQERKIREAFHLSSMYIDRETHDPTWRIRMKHASNLETKVEIKEFPDMTVAYVRHMGPYKGDSALFERLWGSLCRWAGPRGILSSPDAKFFSVYHDNPEITEESKLRVSICVTVPEQTKVDGEIGRMTLKGGTYATAQFVLDADQYSDAWAAVYAGWLPESGYQPEDSPPFEWCHNDPKEHPEGKHIVSICVPVKPL